MISRAMASSRPPLSASGRWGGRCCRSRREKRGSCGGITSERQAGATGSVQRPVPVTNRCRVRRARRCDEQPSRIGARAASPDRVDAAPQAGAGAAGRLAVPWWIVGSRGRAAVSAGARWAPGARRRWRRRLVLDRGACVAVRRATASARHAGQATAYGTPNRRRRAAPPAPRPAARRDAVSDPGRPLGARVAHGPRFGTNEDTRRYRVNEETARGRDAGGKLMGRDAAVVAGSAMACWLGARVGARGGDAPTEDALIRPRGSAAQAGRRPRGAAELQRAYGSRTARAPPRSSVSPSRRWACGRRRRRTSREALRAHGRSLDPQEPRRRSRRRSRRSARHVGRVEIVGGEPGAQVTVNGQPVGLLPLADAVPVSAGPVEIEVRAAGFAPAVKTVNVAAGEYARVPFTLRPGGAGARAAPPRRRGRAGAAGSSALVDAPVRRADGRSPIPAAAALCGDRPRRGRVAAVGGGVAASSDREAQVRRDQRRRRRRPALQREQRQLEGLRDGRHGALRGRRGR